jgi:hypothetical protein
MSDPTPARSVLEQQALDYRNRAEEFRTICETTRNPEVRRTLRAMADSADSMAAAIERQFREMKVC